MRFKAKLFDVQSITQLQSVISAVSRFCKTCCLKLTEDKIYFILNDRLVCGGTTIWCEVGSYLVVVLPQLHQEFIQVVLMEVSSIFYYFPLLVGSIDCLHASCTT